MPVDAEGHTVRSIAGIVLVAAAVLSFSAWVKLAAPLSHGSGMLDGARNLYEGRGFVSMETIPAFLPYEKNPGPPGPYLWYPLLPLVTSSLYHLFGFRPWLLLVTPVASYVLAGVLLFILGRRLFGAATGLAAAPLARHVHLQRYFTGWRQLGSRSRTPRVAQWPPCGTWVD